MRKILHLAISLLLLTDYSIAQSNECGTASAISVTASCSSPTSGSTLTGFSETFVGCSGNADDDGWYQFQATATSHKITVSSLAGDMVIELYSGICTSLVSLSCKDSGLAGDDEVLTATGLTIGTFYRFRVYNYVTGGATFTVCVTPGAVIPANNDCLNAQTLAVNLACVATPGTTDGSTIGGPIACAGTADDDVWYKFVATNAVANVSITGAGMDAVLQVFSGTCASPTSLSCTDLTFSGGTENVDVLGLIPGNTYFYRVYDYYFQSPGSFTTCVTGTATATPINDDPCGAIQLNNVTAECTYQSFSSVGATATIQAGVPLPSACNPAAPFTGGWSQTGPIAGQSKDIWFKVTVPASGNLTITSQPNMPSLTNFVMAAYSNSGTCGGGTFTQLSCSDDNTAYPGTANDQLPFINLTGRPVGSAVYIRVWGFTASAGPIRFCVTTQTNDACANALDICDLNGFSATTSSAYTKDYPGNMRGNNEVAVTYADAADGINTGGIFGQAGSWGTGEPAFTVNIDNNSWIKFTADATTATLNVAVNNCFRTNAGIQMQIFSGTNCTGFVPVSNYEESNIGFSINAIGLTVGNQYYLMVDGFGGDICNYTISAQSGVQFPAIVPPVAACAGTSRTLTAPPVPPGGSWEWQHNGATTQTTTVNPSTTTTYFCLVTGICGKKQLLPVTVTVLPSPLIVISPSAPTICAGDAVTVTASGATTYLWSPNAGSATTTSITQTPTLASTTYTVTGTLSGCTGSKSVVVTRIPLPGGTASGNVTICLGTSTTLNSGGAFGTVTTWTPGGLGTSISVSPASTSVYNYSVFNALTGCTRTGSITVTVNSRPATPVITPSAGTIFCAGGSITLTSSISPNGVYLWSNGETTQTITVSTSDVYSVQTYSLSGCASLSSVAFTITVVAKPPTPTISASGPISFCSGGSVILTSSATSGNSWSNFQSTQSITVSSSGTYTVSVLGSISGCNSDPSAPVVVTVNPTPATPIISASGPTTFCPGGSVVLTSTFASSYLWSPGGATTQSISVTSAGSYSVQINSAALCPSIASAAVAVVVNPTPATPTNTAGGSTTFCAGGSVTLNSSIAPAGMSYLWSPGGATTQSINATSSGSYSVQIISAALCPSSASAAVAVVVNATPAAPTNTAGGPTNFCAGGIVTLTSSVAPAGMTYLWTPGGATTQSISVTNAGSYSVQIISAVLCPSFASAAIAVTIDALPAQPTISGPVSFCAGGSTTLTASAATSYLWSNGLTTASITVNAAGSFTVQVTNAVGCQSVASAITNVSVTAAPAQPTISGTPSFCSGGSTVLTATAGTAYLWSNGATTQVITVNAAGSFTVQVTTSGCASTTSLVTNVTVNALPAAPTISGTASFCAGTSTVLTASAGSSYLWNNGETTQSITLSVAGSFTVQVTNAAGCQSPSSTATAVTVNALPTANAGSDITRCSGAAASVLNSTGSSAGNYLWTPGGPFPSIFVSPTVTTTYTLEVTNATTGCKQTDNVTINVVAPPVVAITEGASINVCAGSPVTLTGSGATTYSWTNGAVTAATTFTPSATGTYTVTGTSGGCTDTESITVNYVALPTASASTATPTICNGGSATLSTTGSSVGAYAWSSGSATVTPATTTTYILTVTDAFGCQQTSPVTVTVTPNPIVSITEGLALAICSGNTQALTATGATSYSWNSGEVVSGILVLPSSTTTYTVTGTQNGCTDTESATVTVTTTPTIAITQAPTATVCLGSAISLNATSSNATTTYVWTSGGTSATESVTPSAGTTSYSVTGTANGCPATATVSVSTLALPIANAGLDVTRCVTSGPTILNSTGSSVGSYLWSEGSGTPSIAVSPTGPSTTYILQVTNGQGCISTDDVIVSTVAALVVSITEGTSVNVCAGSPITLTATGATIYSWSSGESTPSITVTPSTASSYTVTGNAGVCVDTETTAVTLNTLPTLQTAPTSVPSNCITPTGELNAVAIIGAPAITYTWADALLAVVGSTQNLTAVPAGSYSLTVVDGNGCVNSFGPFAVVNANAPNAPTITASDLTNCIGASTSLVASAPDPTTTFSWTGPLAFSSTNATVSLANVNPTNAGNYCVTVAVAGCVSAATCNTIQVLTPPTIQALTLDGDTTICSNTSFTMTASGGTTYVWSGPNGFSAPGATATFNVNATNAGTYTVTGTDAEGCVNTKSIIISELPLPTVTAAANQAIYCLNGQANLSAQGASTYEWSGPNGYVSLIQNPNIIPLTAATEGTYTVIATDLEGCKNTATVLIDIITDFIVEAKISDSTVCPGSPFTISATGGGTYAWTGPNNFVTTDATTIFNAAIEANTGVYIVSVTNAQGCVINDSVSISVGTGDDCLEIPTLVTPNTDGHNDVWFIKGIENFKDAEVSIFNRWGTEIFSTSSYENNWGGQINRGAQIDALDQKDGRVPIGTYFFVLDLKQEGKKPIKGYIELQY